MKGEGALTSDVLKELRLLRPGWLVVKVSDSFTAGIPDAFFCTGGDPDPEYPEWAIPGRTVWLEFKRTTSKGRPSLAGLRLTAAQMQTLGRMHANRIPYHILVRTPDRWIVYNTHGFVLDLTNSAKETAAWLATH